MNIRGHAAQAAIASAVAYPFLSFYENAALFLSIILIDIDHYFDYVLVCRRFGIKDMFRFHGFLWDKRDSVYGISVFHTAEVFLLLFILGFLSRYFWIILVGFLLHMLFDIIYLYRHGFLSVRAFSVIEYAIRKRNGSKGYPVPEEYFWD